MQGSAEEGETSFSENCLLHVCLFAVRWDLRSSLPGISLLSGSQPFSLQQVFSQSRELAWALGSPGSRPGFAPPDLGNFLKLLLLCFSIYEVSTFVASLSQCYSESRMSDREGGRVRDLNAKGIMPATWKNLSNLTY